ncbi:MAG: hypothetical protein JWM19_5869 [Actinomycetia bacterium]|nr:hypothetical protein [Actinomycetes bacterium]
MCVDIPEELRDENVAVRLVEKYFSKDDDGRTRYSGAYFERLGGGGDLPEVAYQVTAEDLLAVSMLSVRVIRYYALDVLVYQGREISGLLAQIPVDVKLTDDGADELIARGGPAWELWQLLHDIKPQLHRNRLGPVAAGKLLARKRPHLIPVYDSYVERVLRRTRTHGTWWGDLRCQLTKDAALVSELEAVRARAGAGHLSLLRTFDIMCWMLGGSPEEAEWAEAWPPEPGA